MGRLIYDYNPNAVEPPEDEDIAEGYDWSPKDDDYWDMKYNELHDEEE